MNSTFVHAFRNDALGTLDAVALAKQIRTGEVSALDVTEAAIARATAINPTLNAIARQDFEAALSRAKQFQIPARDNQKAFAGVPMFIKDNMDLAGLPTQMGTQVFKACPAKRNDPFCDQLLAQGFNTLGKSTTSEFGYSATVEYRDGTCTHNPWHTRYSTGASSGGAGALVASGVIPMAHGNDGGGSIRIPAAACGLVGLKVSRNKFINSKQSNSMPLNLTSDGVLSRTVRDTATFLAEGEKYFHNRKYPRIGLIKGPDIQRLRIAISLEAMPGISPDAETVNTVMQTADILRNMGHTLVPVSAEMPQEFAQAFLLYYGMLSSSVGRFGKLLFKGTDWDMSKYEGLSKALMRHFERRIHHLPMALIRYRQFLKFYATKFSSFDAVLTPVMTHTTPKLGYLNPEQDPEIVLERLMSYVSYTPVQNVLGTPGIALPMGMTEVDHRPIGIQLTAAAGQERRLLSLAYELEATGLFPKIEHLQSRHDGHSTN